MRTLGYIRVSTDEQVREGESLDVQRERLKAYCKAKFWKLVDIVADEGKSAKNLNREGIQHIIRNCKENAIDVVIVTKLDRLTRNVRDLGYLTQDVFEKYGIALSSIAESFDTSTATGKMMMNIIGTIAQWERDVISERTKEVLQFKKSNGRRYGEIPFGFNLAEDNTIVENPAEQKVITKILRMKQKGYSNYKIAKTLTKKGIQTKKGNTVWYPVTVEKLLKCVG